MIEELKETQTKEDHRLFLSFLGKQTPEEGDAALSLYTTHSWLYLSPVA